VVFANGQQEVLDTAQKYGIIAEVRRANIAGASCHATISRRLISHVLAAMNYATALHCNFAI
jgi:hypothetical protein